MLTRRPAGAGRLTFAIAVPAGSRATGASILLPGGLRYAGLRAVDARGRVLPSSMYLSGGRAILSVDDHGAAYPITVDPLVQQAQLIEPGGGAPEDAFGYSVAISGSTIVVGAPHVTTDGLTAAGAAYVFQDDGGGWSTLAATLTAGDAAALDAFGWSVAISGGTIVVGAPTDAEGRRFMQSGDGRGLCLRGAGGRLDVDDADDRTDARAPLRWDAAFGYSVAIDGSTVVVGAPTPTSPASSPEGAAFVYTLSSTGAVTGTPATLTDAGGSHYANLGWSVAISGSTIVAGAPEYANAPGAADLYTRTRRRLDDHGHADHALTLNRPRLHR